MLVVDPDPIEIIHSFILSGHSHISPYTCTSLRVNIALSNMADKLTLSSSSVHDPAAPFCLCHIGGYVTTENAPSVSYVSKVLAAVNSELDFASFLLKHANSFQMPDISRQAPYTDRAWHLEHACRTIARVLGATKKNHRPITKEMTKTRTVIPGSDRAAWSRWRCWSRDLRCVKVTEFRCKPWQFSILTVILL